MTSLPQHLHLIRILYLLLVEKNVSRVALRLNQPQPSASASLRRLRELTGDALLARGARGMVPTQHGESLLKPAKRILDETQSLFVKKSPFVPQAASLALKSFTLPVKFPPMRFYQLWHERVHQAPEHKWLRDQVSAATTALAR